MAVFKGSGVAIVTPFKEGGAVDYDALAELIEFNIANKTDAIIACGTTGEASTLTDDEHIEVIRFTVEKTAGRVPVIAGAGSNYTEHGIELCVRSQKAGASALLLVTPYYNKTSQRGLIEHYTDTAAAVEIPIILYNVPSRTGLNILPKTALELSRIPNIVGIKEASGNISQIAELAALTEGRLDIYSGNDDHVLPVLSLGGIGVISTTANVIPLDFHNMVASYLAGDFESALKIQLKAIPLVNALFCEVNPIPVKAALNLMGFNAGAYRKPLVPLAPENRKLLEREMKAYGLEIRG